MRYTEKQREALEFLFDKRDEAYGLMQFEDGEIYQLAENEFDNYCAIEEIIDTQQKEIEEKDKKINALQKIIIKDLSTNQECISTFCDIPIEEAMDMIEICKTKTIHLDDQEYKKVVELAKRDCIPKEAIREKIEELIKELPLIGDCKKDCEKCFKQYRGSNFVYCYAFHQIKILKELLGE